MVNIGNNFNCFFNTTALPRRARHLISIHFEKHCSLACQSRSGIRAVNVVALFEFIIRRINAEASGKT